MKRRLETEIETELERLSVAARPIDDDEWGSERQINAENMFFIRVEELMPVDQLSELENYCLHATTDERIDRAMALLADIFVLRR